MSEWYDPQEQIFDKYFEHPLTTHTKLEAALGPPPEEQDSLVEILTRVVGDLTSATIPINYFEPTSFLQRMAEVVEYAELLDQAALEKSSLHRLAYIAAFYISAHSATERTLKSFNPLLGETFEHINKGKSEFRFVTEQVSHHPPIAASHAEGKGWSFWEYKGIKSRFRGNSIEIDPYGTFNVLLEEHREHYTWKAVTVCAHNVVVGSTWIDHYGETEIVNNQTGESCSLSFTPCGWLSRGRWEVKGSVYDKNGIEKLTLEAKWNEYVKIVNTGKVIWRATPKKENKWNFSEYAKNLINSVDLRTLPTSDSRIRPDRILLEKMDLRGASGVKHILEEVQRESKRQRAAESRQWNARYFKKVVDIDGQEGWTFIGNYWEMRARRVKELELTKTIPMHLLCAPTSSNVVISPAEMSEMKKHHEAAAVAAPVQPKVSAAGPTTSADGPANASDDKATDEVAASQSDSSDIIEATDKVTNPSDAPPEGI